MNGTELSVEVTYDAADRIVQVRPLKGDDEVTRNLADAQQQAAPLETVSTTPPMQ
jgi:hypothetical protein